MARKWDQPVSVQNDINQTPAPLRRVTVDELHDTTMGVLLHGKPS